MTRTDSTLCPSCGKTTESNSNFCEHCAFDLRKLHESVAPAINRPAKLIGILALSLGLSLSIGYFVLRKVNHANATQPSRFDLTPDKVATLARAQMIRDVEASLPKSVTSFGHFGTYQDMRRAKVLDCAVSMFGKYLDCKPGPKGELFKLDGFDLKLPIGRKMPAVTAVSQVDQTSALADVVLVFEPSEGYDVFQRWKQAFYKPAIQDEAHRVHLRLSDDVWRIEKIE